METKLATIIWRLRHAPSTTSHWRARRPRRPARRAYDYHPRQGWPYRAYCEERAAALGRQLAPYRRRRTGRQRKYEPRDIMPSMRAWARARGLIAD